MMSAKTGTRLLAALLVAGSVSGLGRSTAPNVEAAVPLGPHSAASARPSTGAENRVPTSAPAGARGQVATPDALAAHLATAMPLSGTTWTQQAELTSTTQTLYDGYGEAVALSGNTAAIGAPGTAPSVNDPPYGAVYVFTRTGSEIWSQQAYLLDPQSGNGRDDFFGSANAVALQGNVLVVGAFGATGVTTDTGAAFVYVRSGSTWRLQATLSAADGAYIDGFGAAVALSGRTIVVGAPGKHNGEGAAYVFVYNGQSWVQQAEFVYPGHYLLADFGNAVALWGNTLLVAAPGAPVAFVYARSGTTWSLQAILSAPHSPLLFFGNAIALWGTTALVSSYNFYTPINGAVYIFTRSGTTWSLQATLSPPGGARDDIFGTALGLSYQTAVVTGGYGAFIYGGSGATWTLRAQLIPSDRPPRDIGAAAALQGTTALIGATGAPPAGFVFVRSGAEWAASADALGQGRSASPSRAPGRSATFPVAR